MQLFRAALQQPANEALLRGGLKPRILSGQRIQIAGPIRKQFGGNVGHEA
jgi:hypothetical protein